MTYHPRFIPTLALAVAPLLASAQTVTLDGNWLLQAGTVTSAQEFVAFSYGTGQPLPGRAVFQSFQAGGIEEAPLLDGFYKRLHLNETGWNVSQVLSASPVPEAPASALALAGVMFVAMRSRKNASVD